MRSAKRDKGPLVAPAVFDDRKSEIIKNGNIAGITENIESLNPDIIELRISLYAEKVSAISIDVLKIIIRLCA